jgi:hypothetical protein
LSLLQPAPEPAIATRFCSSRFLLELPAIFEGLVQQILEVDLIVRNWLGLIKVPLDYYDLLPLVTEELHNFAC